MEAEGRGSCFPAPFCACVVWKVNRFSLPLLRDEGKAEVAQ